ncbi:hypothetical protein [Aeromonas salmonicida]|uniref:hypothetical protein n=1 Tax=Aeromonas salmonicida TaxID=645 RepID=UPI003D220EC3
MKELLDELKGEFKDLEYEAREHYPIIFDENGEWKESEEKEIRYFITKISECDNVTVAINSADDINNFKKFIEKEPKIFTDFVGIDFKDYIEVMLSPVSRLTNRTRLLKENPLSINVFYRGTEFNIQIAMIEADSALNYFIENVREIRRRAGLIAKITKVSGGRFSITEQNVRELLFSVLFDIEYSYELSLDTVKYDNFNTRRKVRHYQRPEIPQNTINLVFKKYTPELIEYFHTAEKVDYLPFKYICYFHIIEYFMDKSAYLVVSKKVKELILKPDFHLNSNKYIGDAINVFKRESDRYQTDVVKINRVFNEFITKEEVFDYLTDTQLISHFESEVSLESTKNFKLPKIRFDSENEFYSSLSKRIYSLRCSIVHSNPDFDENKAIPFHPSERNLYELRKEMELIMFISKNIIAKSVE